MKMLFKQMLKFFVLSGTGWLLDFSVYMFIAVQLGFDVLYANILSSIPALTFVFAVSTRKIFKNKKSKVPLWGKYAIYLFYQLILIVFVSWIGQILFDWLSQTSLMKIPFVGSNVKLICKVMITPFTMITNFFVMKILQEKL